MSVNKGRDGKYSVLVTDDAFGNPPDSHGNAIVSGALFLNDLVSAVADIFIERMQVFPVTAFTL